MARRLIVLILLTVCVLSPTASSDAQPRASVRLLGVFDDATGQPVVGAAVVDLTSGTTVVTSATGTVSLAHLAAGTTILQVRKIGYESRMVTVSASDTVSVTVVLRPFGQPLPKIVTSAPAPVSPRLAAFEENRVRGFGHFITREQLVRMEGHLTSDVLRTIPGPRLIQNRRQPSEWYVASTRPNLSLLRNGPGGTCYAAVIVDGIFVYQGADGEPPFNINSIPPDQIAGIEYYAGGATMPVRYNSTRNACGLVVIWTR
ncbi:MAG TPA: carboxypeptidase regulatory-like domain-containing protein [Gemmatimonadaceae bacterium]|nr:carboxypeptidase regulatory-like domain-containing protein [Gemmatimonadaceae bacterium]